MATLLTHLSKLKVHPAAEIFPMLSDIEIRDLAKDISERGLQNHIVTYEGKLLDGRNRLAACILAGIEPKSVEYGGDSPVGFVISANLRRRQLDPSQRAAVAVEIEPMFAAEAKKRMDVGRPKEGVANLRQVNQGKASEQAAAVVSVSPRMVQEAKAIKKNNPEAFERIKSGTVTVHEAKKEIRGEEIKEIRAKMVQEAATVPKDHRYKVSVGNIESYEAEKKFDFIITDPPYLKEYLPLYSTLAWRAKEMLKPDGLLIVMCGQSYLSEIFFMMTAHLDYYWTAAYLTQGQPTPLRTRQVNSTWKPLLFFVPKGSKYKGKIFGDVFVSDANDKSFHEWGQSESGMLSIISGVCLPGQTIFDPFLGAGTTGVAALKHGCLFEGIDLESNNVELAKTRIHGTRWRSL
jgi:16S rRNA G966 N2-methylase RsmD